MTIYSKPRAELFAQDAPPSEIKPFTAWLRGLGIAFDETNGYPELESFNGLLQALNGYIKYLEQNGFAEWSSDLEYPIGAGVRVGAVWYRAKAQNLNKPPATSQNEWTVFLNANDLTYSDPLQVVGGVIGIKNASTTQKGVSRFANSNEVVNKLLVDAFLKPSDIPAMFSQSFNYNGWCKLPNGLILQWGNKNYGGNSGFNTPFPNTALVVFATNSNSQGERVDNAFAYLVDANTFYSATKSSTNNSVTGYPHAWFAIGY